MSFGEAIKVCFQKYATFSGRARRSEYWYFVLFNFLVMIGVTILGIELEKSVGSANIKDTKELSVEDCLFFIIRLALFIPRLAVTIRRLHDIGKSGWYYLVSLIPYIISIILFVIFLIVGSGNDIKDASNAEGGFIAGIIAFVFFSTSLIVSIIIIVWMAKDSQPRENKWGPNPKNEQKVSSENETLSE